MMIRQIGIAFSVCVLLSMSFPCVLASEKDTWAILVSTIDSYQGYGLEAATYKTYHLLRKRGVPAEQIIVFSVDVAAYSRRNPYPGVIYFATEQISSDSENVYDDIIIDYAAENNTASNFLAVLSGNKTGVSSGSGKVLNSGPDSTILIYFTGWSYNGGIIFSELKSYVIVGADEFVPIFDNLYDEGKYDKMLFVFDATQAGLFFDNYLEQDNRAVAITSSGLDGRLFVCVKNPDVLVYTSPCFTYYWLSILEQVPNIKLLDAYNLVRSLLGHAAEFPIPHLYGHLEITKKSVIEFYGGDEPQFKETFISNLKRRFSKSNDAVFGTLEDLKKA